MSDDEFADDLDAYLKGQAYPNEQMVGVEIVWVEDHAEFGALHMQIHHEVEKHEVEEVLLEVPPEVEAKQHPAEPGKTIFWGRTRRGRWLFVSCEDWTDQGVRYLRPITAFEPDEGRQYWSDQ